MAIDFKTLATLSNDPKTKKVLHAVVQGRSVRLNQLVSAEVSHKDALVSINILKDAKLVKETQAPIDDLKTYFVTANGLEADRMVKAA